VREVLSRRILSASSLAIRSVVRRTRSTTAWRRDSQVTQENTLGQAGKMVRLWRRCIGEGEVEVEVEREKSSGKCGRHLPSSHRLLRLPRVNCVGAAAPVSTYRNWIRKARSGAAADALDLDWEGMKDERPNVLNLDGKRCRAGKLQAS